GPQRFPDADLPGALGHRYQHDIHDADTAHHQGDGGNDHQNGHKYAQHGVHHVHHFRRGHDQIGTAVPIDAKEHILNDTLGGGGGILVGTGDQVGVAAHSHHAAGSVDLLHQAIGQIDLVVSAALGGIRLLGQRADDGVGYASYGQGLSQ